MCTCPVHTSNRSLDSNTNTKAQPQVSATSIDLGIPRTEVLIRDGVLFLNGLAVVPGDNFMEPFAVRHHAGLRRNRFRPSGGGGRGLGGSSSGFGDDRPWNANADVVIQEEC